MPLDAILVLGLVTQQEGLSGFSNPTTVTVAAMFVLSSGLQKSGATAAIGRLMVRFGRSYFTALVRVLRRFVRKCHLRKGQRVRPLNVLGAGASQALVL